MNKEEILAKARNSQASMDEMEEHITANGAKFSFTVTVFVCFDAFQPNLSSNIYRPLCPLLLYAGFFLQL